MEKKTTTKKSKPKTETYASKKDLDEVKKIMLDLSKQIETANQQKVEEPKPATHITKEAQPLKAEEELSQIVPTEWRALVDKLLGDDFGLKVEYPIGGNGFVIHISVPKEKSNASDAHWIYYHQDMRSKVIDSKEGINGVESFIKKVAQNLRIENIK